MATAREIPRLSINHDAGGPSAQAQARVARRHAELQPALDRISDIARDTATWQRAGDIEQTTGVAVAQSSRIINLVAGAAPSNINPAPWTSPLPDGGLQLEWVGSKSRIEVEIAPGGSLAYLVKQGTGPSTQYIAAEGVDIENVAQAVLDILTR
jgi:hypothetical protein